MLYHPYIPGLTILREFNTFVKASFATLMLVCTAVDLVKGLGELQW